MKILFKGNVPQEKSYSYSVKNNNNSNVITFELDKIQEDDLDLSSLTCFVKVKGAIIDKDVVTKSVEDDKLNIKWIMKRKHTKSRIISVQLQFEGYGESDIVWQTEMIEITLSNTINADEYIENEYPGELADHEERIQALEQGRSEIKSVDVSFDGTTNELNVALKDKNGQLLMEDSAELPFNNKVDKVPGKGLSANDFTNDEKTKLSDIENNAQVNVLEGIKVNGKELSIINKKVDIEFSSENLISLTYDELVGLRDSGELKAGCFYRITDYETTTTQFDTRSAGHVFDIIVRADSVNKLSEQASAIQRTGDTYFSQCKLEAWKLWYCLDNDTTRFAWADAVNGKGVIYRMIDEFNNEAPYDFKNIQFKRYYNDSAKIIELADDYGYFDFEITGQPFYYNSLFEDAQDEEDFIWCYTFNANEEMDVFGGSRDISIFNEVVYDAEYGEQPIHNNIIKDYYVSRIIDDETSHNILCLNNIVFNAWYEDTTRILIYGNKFDINCYNITFIGSKNYENTFGNNCYSNTFGNNCYSNTFGNNCYYNTFGNDCYYNTFGNNCYSNTFGNDCYSNTFGNDCGSNTFGNNCYSNTFGNNCYYNTFGNDCYYNTFGNNCYSNTFGNNCYSNTFGNDCGSNTFGNDCGSNTFGNDCGSNTFGNDCYYNTFGNDCYYNTLLTSVNNNEIDAGARWNIFEDGVQFIDLLADEPYEESHTYLQNIKIRQGVKGNGLDDRKTITEGRGNKFDITYRCADSEDKTI